MKHEVLSSETEVLSRETPGIVPKDTKLKISPLTFRTGTATLGTCVKAEGNCSPGVKQDTAGAGVMCSITERKSHNR